MAPHNGYPCDGKDAWVSIADGSDPEWRALTMVVGRSEWLADPRYANARQRWENRQALDAEIADWTRGRTRDEVTRLLQAAGVAAFPSYTTRDIADDPHMNERGSVQALTSPEGESRKVVGPPWRFSRTPAGLETWTPKMGEHNEYVFGELLGMAKSELETLVRDKVIY
jgi:benzylsuccinate CoA-transferase BbsF subunit